MNPLSREEMSWDSTFSVARLPPLKRIYRPLKKESLSCFTEYREIEVFHPGLHNLNEILEPDTKETWVNALLDNQWQWDSQSEPAAKGDVTIRILNIKGPLEKSKSVNAYCKVTHLLDPYSYMKGRYQNKGEKGILRSLKKQADPMNQAYVESVASYLVSRLRESDGSPHFALYYGAFRGVADTYEYNITDDYSSLRNHGWFWRAQQGGRFNLKMDASDSVTHSERIEWTRRPSFLENSSTDSDDSDNSEKKSVISLNSNSVKDKNGSIHSDDFDIKTNSDSDSSEDEITEDEEDEDEEESPTFSAILKNFPVLLLYLERCDGLMDDLLELEKKEESWEEKWSAWIFQVIAALCAMQHLFSMTHNDLHTNNIVWSHCDEEFLYYRANGHTWQVPTYGKVFKIIDFGRSIYKLKDKVVYSDDFLEGNDAGNQYNFGDFKDESKKEVLPNPSFDLCRLATSLFESLYPEAPEEKRGGKVLSNEPGLTVKETKSDLYNCLWTWMLTESGENILIDEAGEEKYPDFELYSVIAEQCKGARPRDQVNKKPFSVFHIKADNIPKEAKIYSLFF